MKKKVGRNEEISVADKRRYSLSYPHLIGPRPLVLFSLRDTPSRTVDSHSSLALHTPLDSNMFNRMRKRYAGPTCLSVNVATWQPAVLCPLSSEL
ncbi:hypothetical protein SLA2020_509200 [Shorea laevis]